MDRLELSLPFGLACLFIAWLAFAFGGSSLPVTISWGFLSIGVVSVFIGVWESLKKLPGWVKSRSTSVALFPALKKHSPEVRAAVVLMASRSRSGVYCEVTLARELEMAGLGYSRSVEWSNVRVVKPSDGCRRLFEHRREQLLQDAARDSAVYSAMMKLEALQDQVEEQRTIYYHG